MLIKKQKGFTLLEILVSIIILSIGAVAVLGLLTASIKSGVDAKYQSVALQSASDLSEMMKSNTTVASQSSSNPYLIDKTGLGSASTLSPFKKAGSAQELAARDIEDWYYQLSMQLPGSRTVVCFDDAPYDSKGVARWDCTGGSNLFIKIGWSLRTASKGENMLDLARPNVVIPVGLCNPIDKQAQAACIGEI